MEIVKNIIDNRYTYALYLAIPATVLSCLVNILQPFQELYSLF